MRRCFEFLVSLGLLALGCSSTGVGNPGVVATQELSVSEDPDPEPDATDPGQQLDPANLKHAVMVFGELRYLACDPADDNDAIITGPILVDLAKQRVEPAIAPVAIPSGGFCGIDATLAAATAPPALAGRSMFFDGTRSDGVRFLVFANLSGTLHMRPLSGVVWPTDGKHRWLWAFRPRRWLLPSELNNEPLSDSSTVIAIDADLHPTLYALIRDRVARRSTLHVDSNGNGQLDADERDGAALIGEGLDSID
jgi:hypothetical protein